MQNWQTYLIFFFFKFWEKLTNLQKLPVTAHEISVYDLAQNVSNSNNHKAASIDSTRKFIKVGGPTVKLHDLSQSVTDRLTFVDSLAYCWKLQIWWHGKEILPFDCLIILQALLCKTTCRIKLSININSQVILTGLLQFYREKWLIKLKITNMVTCWGSPTLWFSDYFTCIFM